MRRIARSTAAIRSTDQPRAISPSEASMCSRWATTPSTSDCAKSETGGASEPAMRRRSTSSGSSARASDSKRMSSARLRAFDREPLRGGVSWWADRPGCYPGRAPLRVVPH